jgi:hypothetical protein
MLCIQEPATNSNRESAESNPYNLYIYDTL